MPTRRDALLRLAQWSALGAFAPPLVNALRAQPDAAGAIARGGVQLYTVRAEMERSVEATLARVAQVGYREVEFAGYFGRTPAQVAALLKANGLTAPSTHIGVAELSANTPAVLDGLATMGHRYAVIPWLAAEERRTLEQYRRLADRLNELGRAAKARGIQLAYHNHDFEFQPLEGQLPYDLLLARCDADLVKGELDLYWINKAGHDPLAYFARHPGRFHLVHVKDLARDGSMTDVGAGMLPFARYVAQAAQAGIRHWFVERDDARDPFASITASLAALRAL